VKIIQELSIYEDGSSDIEILGEEFFKIEKFHPRMGDKLYPGSEVILLNQDETHPVSENFMKELGRYLEKTHHELIPELLTTTLDAFTAARLIALNEVEKLNLVKSKFPADREVILMNKLKLLIKIQEQA